MFLEWGDFLNPAPKASRSCPNKGHSLGERKTPPPPALLRRPEGRAPPEDGSRGVLPGSASFCGSRVLGLWPWPPPLPLLPNEGQGDLVKEPHSKEAPVLRLWVDVNVGGTSLDPRPAPASLGFPRTLPVVPPSLDGTQAEQWVTQSGCCRAHHTQPWGAGRATELSPLPPRETQPP